MKQFKIMNPKWILIAAALPVSAFGQGTAAAMAAMRLAAEAAAAKKPASTEAAKPPAAVTPETPTSNAAGSPLSLTAPGAGAPAATQPPPVTQARTPKLRDVSLAEMKTLFAGFSIAKRGTEPNAYVLMTGVGYNECLSDANKIKILITNTATNPELGSVGLKGFRVQMMSDAIECTKKAQGVGKCEDTDADCFKLKVHAGAKLMLANQGDGKIALFSDPAGEDVEGYKSEPVEPAITFKSAQTLALEEQKRLDDIRKTKIKLDETIVNNCRANSDQLAQAFDALNRLVAEGALIAGQFEKKKAELELKELDLLVAKLKKAPPLNDDAEVQAIMDFAENHEDLHLKVASAINDRIGFYLKQSTGKDMSLGLQYLGKTRELAEEANTTLSLEDAEHDKFDRYLERGLPLAEAKFKALGGWAQNPDLRTTIQEQMQKLQSQYITLCSSSMGQDGKQTMRDADGCRALTNQRDELYKVIANAQRIDAMPNFANAGQQQPAQNGGAPGFFANGGAPTNTPVNGPTMPNGFGNNSIRPQMSPIMGTGFQPAPVDAWSAGGYVGNIGNRNPAGYFGN